MLGAHACPGAEPRSQPGLSVDLTAFKHPKSYPKSPPGVCKRYQTSPEQGWEQDCSPGCRVPGALPPSPAPQRTPIEVPSSQLGPGCSDCTALNEKGERAEGQEGEEDVLILFSLPVSPREISTDAGRALACSRGGRRRGGSRCSERLGAVQEEKGTSCPLCGLSPSHEIIPGWCCWKLPNELSCPNDSHQLPGKRNACELVRHGMDALMGLLWLLTRRQQPLIFLNTYLPHRPGTAPGHLLLPGPGPGHEPAGHEGHVQQPRTAPVGAQVLPAQTVTEAQRGAAGPSRAWG